MSFLSRLFHKNDKDNVSGAGLDCLRDWTNNVQSTIPIYVAERDYEVGFFSPLFGLCYCTKTKQILRITWTTV